MGLDKQVVDAGYVASLFVGDGWENPFAKEADTSATASLRRAFEMVARRLTPSQKIYFKRELSEMLGAKRQEAAKAAEAQEATLAFLAPKIEMTFPPEYSPAGGEYLVENYQGRPVLIGEFKLANSNGAELMFDAFRKDHPEKMIVRLGGEFSGPVIGNRAGFELFQSAGQDFVYQKKGGKVFKLPSGAEALTMRHLRAPRIPSLSNRTMDFEGGQFFTSGNRLKLAAAWTNTGTKNEKVCFLGLADADEKSDWNVIEYGIAQARPVFKTLDDHTILAWSARGKGYGFFDLTGKPVKLSSIGLSQVSFDSATPAAVLPYSIGGEWRALVGEMVDAEHSKIAVVDIRKGTLLRELTIPPFRGNRLGKIQEMNSGGRPTAYVQIADEIALIDLQSEQVRMIPAPLITSNIGQFIFQGRMYLAWGTRSGELKVYDVEGQTMGASLAGVQKSAVASVLTFEYEGVPLAYLIGKLGEPPVIVNMIGAVK